MQLLKCSGLSLLFLLAIVSLSSALEAVDLPYVDPQVDTGSDPLKYTAICRPLLNHTRIWLLPGLSCVADMDSIMVANAAFASGLSFNCRSAFMKYMCSFWGRPASDPSYAAAFPSQSLCDALNATHPQSTCTGVDDAYISAYKTASGLPGSSFVYNFTSGFICQSTDNGISFRQTRNSLEAAQQLMVPSCEAYKYPSTGVCRSVLGTDYKVYTPAGSVQDQQEFIAAQLNFTFLLLTPTCRDQFVKFFCYSVFPKCVRPINGFPAAFPSFPTQELCQIINSPTCYLPGTSTLSQDSFDPRLKLFLNRCNATIATARFCVGNETNAYLQPRFSTAASGYLIPQRSPNSPLYIPANNNTDTANVLETLTCPDPLVIPDNRETAEVLNGGSCAVPCPVYLYDKDVYLRGNDILLGLSFISLVLLSFQIATFLVFPHARKKIYNLLFTIDLWIVSVAFFFTIAVKNSKNSYGPFWESGCVDNAAPNNRGWCLFQAICIFFGGFSAVCWWFLQALDLYLQIWWHANRWSSQTKQIQKYAYFGWGYGYPLLMLIICAGLGKLGNGQNGVPYCFITDNNLSWIIFYAPIGVMSVTGLLLMFLIISAIFKTSQATGAHKKRGAYLIYIRPLFFVITFLFVWIFIFSYRLNEEAKLDSYKEDGKKFATCLLFTRPASKAAVAFGVSGASVVECTERPNTNEHLFFGVLTAVAGSGLWTFLTYFSKGHFRLWYLLIKEGRNVGDETTGTDEESRNSKLSPRDSVLKRSPSSTSAGEPEGSPSMTNLLRTNSGRQDSVMNASSLPPLPALPSARSYVKSPDLPTHTEEEETIP